MAKFLGLLDVTIDGVTLPLAAADSTFDPGGVTRTTVKGNKVLGYREEVKEAELECTVGIDDTFSVDFYRGITSSTIVLTSDTGQTWHINGGWCSEPPPISQKDGSSKVKFMGSPADEILS